jgi:hypothetical protein
MEYLLEELRRSAGHREKTEKTLLDLKTLLTSLPGTRDLQLNSVTLGDLAFYQRLENGSGVPAFGVQLRGQVKAVGEEKVGSAVFAEVSFYPNSLVKVSFVKANPSRFTEVAFYLSKAGGTIRVYYGVGPVGGDFHPSGRKATAWMTMSPAGGEVTVNDTPVPQLLPFSKRIGKTFEPPKLVREVLDSKEGVDLEDCLK